MTLLLFFQCSNLWAQKLDTTSLYQHEKLPKTVNSSYHEGAPVVSEDGNTIYFFRTNHPQNKFGKEGSQDVWFSTQTGKGDWSPAQRMDDNINRYKSNQVMSVVNGGKTLLLSGGKTKNDRGLSLSSLSGGKWSKPEEIQIDHYEHMNKGKFYGASMTEDAMYIIHYFSEVANSVKSDLYLSKKISPTHYSKPVKLLISTDADEFGPFITADEKHMYFASNRPGGFGDMDIYVTHRLDDSWLKWSKPKNISEPVNTKGFDAYFSVDSTGRNAYTTRSYISADGGSLDILGLYERPIINFNGTVIDKDTKEPVEATISLTVLKVGEMDFFTDDQGKFDFTVRDKGIYVFKIQNSEYEILYDTLNLSNPKQHSSFSKTFKLTPHKPDVYLHGYVYNKETKELLGSQIVIQTGRHEKMTIKSDPTTGYYEVHIKHYGKTKIAAERPDYYDYSEDFTIERREELAFDLQKDIYLQPKANDIVIEGFVTNASNKHPIITEVKVKSPSGKTKQAMSAKNGFYSMILPEPGTYKIYAHKEGFLNKTDSITVTVPKSKTAFKKDLALESIEIGKTVRINDIYFDFDRSTLRSESYEELDRVVAFFKENPTLIVEISGHTDDRGSDVYNMNLSQERAEAVMKYLIRKGIKEDRLSAQGYGETKPEVNNDTDENRQINRRVQFTILKK